MAKPRAPAIKAAAKPGGVRKAASGLVDGVKPVWRTNPELSRTAEPYLVDGRPPPPGRILAKAFQMDAPESLDGYREGWPGNALEDRELVGCALLGWPIRGANRETPGTAEWLARRPVVRRLHLRETAVYTTGIEGFVLEACVFEGLRTSKPFFFTGCAFRHVTLRGFIGAIDVRERAGMPVERPDLVRDPGEPELQGFLDGAASDAFYDDVDWAIDLREADLSELSIEGVPPEKILRNPELHAILRREQADADRFLAVPGVEFTWFPTRAMDLARSRAPSCLLMAHPRSKSFDLDRKAIAALRRAGLVE